MPSRLRTFRDKVVGTFSRKKSNKELANNANKEGRAHLTWARRSLTSTLLSTGSFIKQRLWVWPIVAVVLLLVIGTLMQRSIKSTMKANLQSQLMTLLNVERAMLQNWAKTQEANAQSIANNSHVREMVGKLLLREEGLLEANSSESTQDLHKLLSKELATELSAHGFSGYFISTDSERILAASNSELVSRQGIPEYDKIITRAASGVPALSPPFASVVPSRDKDGIERTGVPVMYVSAPIRNQDFQTIAVIALQISPEKEFTRILQLGRMGESGETYAIDSQGWMASNSRFDEALILLGLIPDRDDSRSILSIAIRDPGGDMTNGFRPVVRRSNLALTKMAASATAKLSGYDVDGYRDYRGVPVVGAWSWLNEYDMGIATEIDVREAYRPLRILQTAFWSLFSLLAVSAAAIFAFTIVVSRLQREARKAAIEAKQLGQYQLEEKLGAGAMGIVYKARHAMLSRPTAIKLLNVDEMNPTSVKRFEREVQMSCQLNHPNTVAIYDYGRTPEDVFYYAMEYLDGIELQDLIDECGPQPSGRVARILVQVCGSLYEAHQRGMVHRDIKPANIMLNDRGCEPDMVKVLDFGLVKSLNDEQADSKAGRTDSLTGTPLYMSPEAITTPSAVDARSDLYAVGAVGYFLLTAKSVFEANTLVELCHMHIATKPKKISEHVDVNPKLEEILLSCLAKSIAERPASARDLANRLREVVAQEDWQEEDAVAWWSAYRSGGPSEVAKLQQSKRKSSVAGTRSVDMGATAEFQPPSV